MSKKELKELEIQEKELAKREIEGSASWGAELSLAYDRLIVSLNSDGQNNMKMLTTFWQVDCHCNITFEELLELLEEWGYAKRVRKEDGKDTVICKKPYTNILLIPRISVEGAMYVYREFVISDEVAKELKDYFGIA